MTKFIFTIGGTVIGYLLAIFKPEVLKWCRQRLRLELKPYYIVQDYLPDNYEKDAALGILPPRENREWVLKEMLAGKLQHGFNYFFTPKRQPVACYKRERGETRSLVLVVKKKGPK